MIKGSFVVGGGALCGDGAELRKALRAGASTGERRLWDR